MVVSKNATKKRGKVYIQALGRVNNHNVHGLLYPKPHQAHPTTFFFCSCSTPPPPLLPPPNVLDLLREEVAAVAGAVVVVFVEVVLVKVT